MGKKIIAFICGLMLFSGTTLAAGNLTDNLIVIPEELTVKETITITSPVKSPNELSTTILNSLANICATLYLSVDNTNQWFTDKQVKECFSKAAQKSPIAGPYIHGYKYTYTTGANRFIKMNIYFNYNFPRKTLIRYITTSEMKATDIINTIITPDMDDYQKELTLHDYIAKHTSYDYNNYQNDTVPSESYTPYGILIKGTGVCEGFAQTMRLLLSKVGIECIFVSGTAAGAPHAWNIVKIAGAYYQLDLTWDDPVGVDRSTYHYFNLTDDMIALNHLWDRSRYPRCDATEYNYYKINNLQVENLEECQQRIQDAVNVKQKNISLMVLNFDPAAFEKEIASLLTNLHFVGKYIYSYDKELGTVEIEFKYGKS